MKSDFDHIQDRNAFEEEHIDFLAEKDLYLAESVFAVYARSRELHVGVPAEFSCAWKCRELAPFFRDEDGETVPDCDAVADLAASLFFVR